MKRAAPLRAVTFDCWGTLIYEGDPERGRRARVAALCELVERVGPALEPREGERVLGLAHRRHVELWEQNVATGSPEMARWMLAELELAPRLADELARELSRRLEEASLPQPIHALPGARETLQHLRARGIRTALICDTGFSPGRIVRRLLDAHGLLELLEVQVFSDEAGVPKPDPRVFRMALRGIGVEPAEAVHVGDLRRTDVLGARGVGMGTVRIRDVHDDRSDHPEADAVADSHCHLCELLGLR